MVFDEEYYVYARKLLYGSYSVGAKPRSGSFCFPSLMFEQNPEFEIVSES